MNKNIKLISIYFIYILIFLIVILQQTINKIIKNIQLYIEIFFKYPSIKIVPIESNEIEEDRCRSIDTRF